MSKTNKNIKLYKGDCLEIMPNIPACSVDLILCDLPYGTTSCSWDNIISFEHLWKEYIRLIKKKSLIVLFGQEPFSSLLRCSNLKYYKYDWVWIKNNAPNYLNKQYMPGKLTENICVFSIGGCSPNTKIKSNYFPVLEKGKPFYVKNGGIKKPCAVRSSQIKQITIENTGTRLPNNVLHFDIDKEKYHPTEKPVALLEYLIKTYTNEGDLVLDNCMGSGSTGVAAVQTNRRFIGIEKEPKYFEVAQKRIYQATGKPLPKDVKADIPIQLKFGA